MALSHSNALYKDGENEKKLRSDFSKFSNSHAPDPGIQIPSLKL